MLNLEPLPVGNESATSINTSSILVSWQPPADGNYDSFGVSVNGVNRAMTDSNCTVIDQLNAGSLYNFTIETISFDVTSVAVPILDAPTCTYLRNFF